MTWGNPPKLEPSKPKQGKVIQPQDIAKDSEHSHQTALFAWAALSVGKYPQLKWMFAIPNGGLRDIRTATNLKAEGVKAGVPDIMLPWPNCNFAGLFIELKVGKNKTSKEQDAWLNYLSSMGYMTTVQWSWEGAKEIIVDYIERA